MRLERETQAQLCWVYGTMLEPLYKKRQPPRGSRLFASTVFLHQLGQADGVSWYPVGTLFGVPLHCLKEAVEGATGVGTSTPTACCVTKLYTRLVPPLVFNLYTIFFDIHYDVAIGLNLNPKRHLALAHLVDSPSSSYFPLCHYRPLTVDLRRQKNKIFKKAS